ncbi:hypothetical protein [Geodermatophilus sp. DSM 45219]|uniref:hypothetical protein n=1 Tax=Geodermatophilus sp. DSM 45219 TaxID=1881103 RepID=UPI00088549E4|nr:hypothetical protein [Geodermatophilus sp. DSM 45219]SDN42893.1 hypothetical protein SAMN05428965_0355 [Geodermatophilus sp. DSM 45219]
MSQPYDAVPPPAPDWVAQTPAWPAPPAHPAPVPVADPRRGTGSLVAAAAVGAAVLSVGVLVAALLSSLLLSSALTRAMEAQTEAVFGGGSSASGTVVEQGDPVEPGVLGDDPELDGYAADCFAGTLDACDQLFYESTPFSEYERYGSTCGGRVKPYTVAYCADLD